MTTHSIRENVAEFICERVHSIEQLEAILLLHGSKGASWTAARAAKALQIAEPLAEGALAHLAVHGIVIREDGVASSWRYAPARAELAQQVDELVVEYPTARIEIVTLISQCAMDRIRTAHLRAFAQAFLLKGPKRNT